MEARLVRKQLLRQTTPQAKLLQPGPELRPTAQLNLRGRHTSEPRSVMPMSRQTMSSMTRCTLRSECRSTLLLTYASGSQWTLSEATLPPR